MIRANTIIEECDSTNRVARTLAESGAVDGSWVSSLRQQAGRGRLYRTWESLEGNLFLSVILRHPPRERWTWVPLFSALAVLRAVRALDPTVSNKIKIKWPNDLWAEGCKVCGVLVESSSSREGGFLIVGIGLNVTQSPKHTQHPAISLSELNSVAQLDQLRTQVVSEIRSISHGMSVDSEFQALCDEYKRSSWITEGDRIQWFEGEKKNEGVYQDLGSFGEARVLVGQETRALYTDEVSRVRRGT